MDKQFNWIQDEFDFYFAWAREMWERYVQEIWTLGRRPKAKVMKAETSKKEKSVSQLKSRWG